MTDTATVVPEGTPSAAPIIKIADFYFLDASGNRNPTIPVKAGESMTFDVVNTGLAVHDIHVADASGKYATAFCTTSGSDPCSKPVTGGSTAKLTVKFDAPGTYECRCDFHPHIDDRKVRSAVGRGWMAVLAPPGAAALAVVAAVGAVGWYVRRKWAV